MHVTNLCDCQNTTLCIVTYDAIKIYAVQIYVTCA